MGNIDARPEINLLSAKSFSEGHPHALYDWLRENDPVHWHEEPSGPGFWVLTRWKDIRWVNSNEDDFSHWPVSVIEDYMTDEHYSMVNLDPPVHTKVRKVVSPDFLPGAVRRRMPNFVDAAQAIIDEVKPREECDVVRDIAGKMASYVTADILAIPRKDAVDLYHFIEIGLAGGGVYTVEEAQAAMKALEDYSVGVWDDRRRNPGEDIPSKLANSSIDGAPMSMEDFCANMSLLIVGAGDTTRHLIAGGLLALLDFPDQRRYLEADIDHRMPAAIEEMLRWVTPVAYNRRMAKRDLTIGGARIKAGQKVIVYYGAGNRDPEVFDDPHTFNVARSPNPHVTFSGQGAHFCLGAHVARAEASAMIRLVLSELPSIELTGPVKFEESNFVMGPATMPIRF